MSNKYLSLFIILTITFLVAIGGYTTSFQEPWYSQLTLASFNPPAVLTFGLLYI